MQITTSASVRLALVHDYLTQRGGAERVALAIANELPVEAIYTTIYSPKHTFEEFKAHDVQSTALNAFPLFKKDPRRALPFLSNAIDSLSIEEVDAVICSSSGWAHAVKTDLPKVVYFHTPARWLYESDDYLLGHSKAVSYILAAFKQKLVRWDKAAVTKETTYIANSTVVKDRIERVYGVDARVIHPPIALLAGPEEPVPGVEAGFWLTVARGRGYKNTDKVIAAANLAKQPLVVVGGNPASSTNAITYTGPVSDAQLRWLYTYAVGLVAMSHEDFGLTPVEANSFGTPVLALRAGGYLDTVENGVNGLFVSRLDVKAIAQAMKRFLDHTWDATAIRKYSQKFSLESFSSEMLAVIQDARR